MPPPIQHHKNRRSTKLMIRSPGEIQPFMDFSSSSTSSSSSTNYLSSSDDDAFSHLHLPLVGRTWGKLTPFKAFSPISAVASIFRSLFPTLQSLLIPTCQWLTVTPTAAPIVPPRSNRKRLTGTFFGQKKSRVSFAVQETPRSEPILLLDLATPTSHLVKEMASGMVRILLECERNSNNGLKRALWDEPVWTMYCNGHKLGYAVSRPCTQADFHVLGTVQAVSVGAGVMPAPPLVLTLPPPHPMEMGKGGVKNDHEVGVGGGSEIMYMRAKFERVIGSRDSEAFYMINPDCSGGGKFNNGGPELSIFLLRI